METMLMKGRIRLKITYFKVPKKQLRARNRLKSQQFRIIINKVLIQVQVVCTRISIIRFQQVPIRITKIRLISLFPIIKD